MAPHGARGQTHVPRHLARCRALASLPDRLFETLAEGRLTRQLCDLLGPYPTIRALHPVGLHHHRRPVLKAGQVAHFALADFVDLAGWHVLSTAGANQLQSRFLPPHPQLQPFALIVNLHAINPVSRPSQNPRPVVCLHLLRLAKGPAAPVCPPASPASAYSSPPGTRHEHRCARPSALRPPVPSPTRALHGSPAAPARGA